MFLVMYSWLYFLLTFLTNAHLFSLCHEIAHSCGLAAFWTDKGYLCHTKRPGKIYNAPWMLLIAFFEMALVNINARHEYRVPVWVHLLHFPFSAFVFTDGHKNVIAFFEFHIWLIDFRCQAYDFIKSTIFNFASDRSEHTAPPGIFVFFVIDHHAGVIVKTDI